MLRLAVLVISTCAFLLAVAGGDDRAMPDPPGTLVDLGGRRLHVTLAGSGTPSVVIENGAGAFSIDWTLVQSEVAKFARVVTYDRAGYAWSDLGPTQDTIEQTMDDLHLLLRNADVQPPYVMVGASLGCAYVRAYQRRFPEQVVGLVFVDGTHDEAITFMVNGQRKPISHLSAEELQAAYKDYERSEGSNDTWHTQQAELAALSRTGKLIKADDSGHMIHLYRPDLVAQAIHDVVAAARRGGESEVCECDSKEFHDFLFVRHASKRRIEVITQ